MATATITIPTPPLFDEARLAVAGFLARYSEPTRRSYTSDLRQFFAWCDSVGVAIFEAKRPHLELWARSMEERGLARATIGRRLSTVAGFYRIATLDGLLEHSPAQYVRRPKIDTESATLGLDRMELSAFIAQGAAAGPVDHALACLLGLLGLRVSEACSIDIEDLGTDRGHRTDRPRKGLQTGPTAPPAPSGPGPGSGGRRTVVRAAPAVPGRHPAEPTRGHPDRDPAGPQGGITKHISPHSLRHSFITAALDAGVALRDVQIAARHADPRTTTRYDRAKNNLDRHASYIVTAFVAGAG